MDCSQVQVVWVIPVSYVGVLGQREHKCWRYFGLKRQSPPILQRWPILEICLSRTKLCLQWEKELVARQRLVSPWWQRWSLCWSHTGVSWSAVGVGGTWSLPWSERWSVGEVGLSKLVRALPGQWGKCFLAERKTHSRSPGWNLEDISWDSF